MLILQNGEYDIQKLMNDNGISIKNEVKLTKNQLVSQLIKELLKTNKSNMSSVNDPFGGVFVSKSNPDVFVFDTVDTKDEVLVIPAVVPLKSYESYVRSIYAVGKNKFKAIAYSTGSNVQILNDFQRNTLISRCESRINSISANTIEIAIDLKNSKINKLLDHVVKQLGYDAITALFPNLKGINFRADFSVLKRSEFHKSKFGSLVS